MGLSDQCVEQCASILPLFLTDLELDMTQNHLGFRIVFTELKIHFTGLVWVLTLLEITPVKIQISIEIEKELFIKSEDIQDLCIFVGLIFKIVEDFLPQLNVVHLSHQHPLVAVTGIFNCRRSPLQFNHFSPYFQILLESTLIPIKIPYFNLFLQIKPCFSIS